MPTSLRDSARFIPLANLVAEHGIHVFVEANATDTDGIEAAKRLGLRAFIHSPNTRTAEVFSQRYPDVDVYDGDALSFLRAVLPELRGATYFLLDRSSPTFDEETMLLDNAATTWHVADNWFVDTKGEVAQADASFDRSEAFDRNWIGPSELKPRVYRTQSEKDTWHAVVVNNEYKLGPLEPDDVVVDIGAHIGSFSYLAWLNGSRHVFAFEVDPWHLEAAHANLEGLDIAVSPAAVVRSDKKRQPTYHYDGKWNVFGDQGREVPSISLDEIIGMAGPVRFLKTDSEGSEWPILYTCTKLDQVQEIAGEYHEDVNFHDASLPPCKMVHLAKYLWERWGFHVTFTSDVPGIGNFYAKR